MNELVRLLSSRVKAEIFGLLFGVETHELHVRELERQSGLSISTVRQELKNLATLGLVIARISGNRTYYHANLEHPLYPELHSLVLKTCGLVGVLRGALDLSGINVAFVFGSIAAGSKKSGSDIDLLVVGSHSLRGIVKRLSGVSAKLGREINPYVLDKVEFARRTKMNDHFLTTVLKSPKLFVIGNDDELARLGSERMAAST